MTNPVAAVGIPSTQLPTAAAVTDPSAGMLDPQAFLKLLVAQLQYQDPTSPADMGQFMSQTATLSQTQAISAMQTALTGLLTTEQAQTATSMLGKTVSYTDAQGAFQTGLVTGATSLTTGAQVQIGSVTVPLSSITGVTT
jgi:flagellar basal-body rod modification protein FlgD